MTHMVGENPLSRFLSASVIVRIIGSTLLFWSLSSHEYGYYTLLRWVVCGGAAYCVYISKSLGRIPWVWFFGIVALAFNPLVPVRLDRVTWGYVDVSIGIMFIVSLLFVRERERQ
jgi:hypothetical protein